MFFCIIGFSETLCRFPTGGCQLLTYQVISSRNLAGGCSKLDAYGFFNGGCSFIYQPAGLKGTSTNHPLLTSLGHPKPLTRCKAGDSHSLKSSHFISFRCFKKNCSSGHSFPENWGKILVSSPCWLRTWLTWPLWCYVQFLTTSVAFHPYCQVEDGIVFSQQKTGSQISADFQILRVLVLVRLPIQNGSGRH